MLGCNSLTGASSVGISTRSSASTATGTGVEYLEMSAAGSSSTKLQNPDTLKTLDATQLPKDVASCSTISSALISRQTQATHIDRQTALERSTTIDLYDLSIDHEDNVFRDTTTSPDTSFLPTSVSRNTLPPKNTNRLRDTTQNIRDYFSGDQRWPCGLTNFHFSLCFGMVGFTVFWTGLLLRIYLPHEYFS